MSSQSTRINMIKQQLRTGDVLNEKILALYDEMSRDDFVQKEFKPFAYSDMQIPLEHHQRMLTPLEEGKILQALNLTGHEVVLEVGTGSGFFTALLSRLCKQVISIDYFASFTSAARQKLTEYHCTNVALETGDACRGWLDKAPYDVMIFTGALESLDEMHRLQLLPGGQLFALIGKDPVIQGQLHRLDHEGHWQTEVLFETNLPPLIDNLAPANFVF